MKDLNSMSLEDRIANIESGFYSAVMTLTLLGMILVSFYLKVTSIYKTPVWLSLLLTGLFGIFVGNLMIKLWVMSAFIENRLNIRMKMLYINHKKVIDPISIGISELVAITLFSYILGIGIAYGLTTVVLALVANWTYDRFIRGRH